MKELVVLGFASRELAEEARSVGAELDREGVLQLDGAALAYRRDDGRVELVQPMRLAPVGAAVGAVAGAAGAGLSALGLNQWFLRQLDGTLGPGRAALFVIVSDADPEPAIQALRPLAPRVLRTTLPADAERRLLAAFTDTAPQATSTSPSPPASE